MLTLEKSLGVDYVRLEYMYMHRDKPWTPIEERVQAMKEPEEYAQSLPNQTSA